MCGQRHVQDAVHAVRKAAYRHALEKAGSCCAPSSTRKFLHNLKRSSTELIQPEFLVKFSGMQRLRNFHGVPAPPAEHAVEPADGRLGRARVLGAAHVREVDQDVRVIQQLEGPLLLPRRRAAQATCCSRLRTVRSLSSTCRKGHPDGRAAAVADALPDADCSEDFVLALILSL